MVSQMVKNTIVRNEIFYFNICLPNKQFYRKSLKTDSPSKARKLVGNIMANINKGVLKVKEEIDDFIETLIQNKLTQVIGLTNAILNPLSFTAKHHYKQWYNSTYSARYNNHHVDTQGGKYQKYPSYNTFITSKLSQTGNQDSTYSIYNITTEDDVISNEDAPFYDEFANPSIHSEHYKHLDDYIKNSVKSMVESTLANDYTSTRKELAELKQKFKQVVPQELPLQLSSEPTALQSDCITFSEASKLYYEYREKSKYSKLTALRATLERLSLDFGDTHLDLITIPDIMEFYQRLLVLPKNNKSKDTSNPSPYAGLSLIERWEYAKDNDKIDKEFSYSREMIKKDRQVLYDIFLWASVIESILPKNPLPKDIQDRITPLPTGRRTRRVRFSDSDALRIINYCKADLTQPLHWAILLMAYHGLRNNEALSLKSKNIIINKETGIHYLYIEKGKTPAAERKIPIHKELLSLGFYEFSQKSENLFKSDTPTLSRYYFTKLRPKLDIPETTEEGHLLSLYSFRHCFSSKLGTAQTANAYVKYLIGHRDITIDTYTQLDTAQDFIKFQSIINSIHYLE